MTITAFVMTLSDKGSAGKRTDHSGPLVAEMLKQAGIDVRGSEILPDEQGRIEDRLRELSEDVDLIITTGGTGLSPRDVTPEATLNVIQRRVPGMAEAMRAASMLKTKRAILSRAEAGVCGDTLIVNLPGSPKAARENLEVILGELPHAIEKIKGSTVDCAEPDKETV